MPVYDLVCEQGHIWRDQWLKVGERPPCATCGSPVQTYWDRSPSVIPDEIPGGILIKHGLCDPKTGEPVRYDSKSAIAREARRRGLVNWVEHVDIEGDRHTVTSRWI